ncbi:MAG: glycosyltransferase family 2 protein [Planctomycetota bacterium]|nr:glycosyltransferase family 2 protein [Planctomycetota bacterium]
MTIPLSVVIPVFGSTASLGELVKRLNAVLKDASPGYEVILVDDGGGDDNWAMIKELADMHSEVRGLRLSKNFGQHQAIEAGFHEAKGEITVVMDCDLQDPPEDIPRLLAALEDGADIAIGVRNNEPAGFVRQSLNRVYYKFLSVLSGYRIEPNQGTFSAIKQPVATACRELRELDRPYRLVLDWLGFEVARVQFDRVGRFAGKSTYTLGKLLRLALGGIVFQSTRLLYASALLGLICSFLAIGLGVVFIISALAGSPPTGWASTIVVILMIGGLNLMAIGILGIYIGKIFHQTRGRPPYIVRERASILQSTG